MGFDLGLQTDVIPTIIIIIILLLLFTGVRSRNLHFSRRSPSRGLLYYIIYTYIGVLLLYYPMVYYIVIDENNRKILTIPPRYAYSTLYRYYIEYRHILSPHYVCIITLRNSGYRKRGERNNHQRVRYVACVNLCGASFIAVYIIINRTYGTRRVYTLNYVFFFLLFVRMQCNVITYSRRIFSRLIRLAAVTAAFRAKRLLLLLRRRVGLNAASVQDGCAQLGGSRSALGLCPVGRSFLFILTFVVDVVVTHSPLRSASSLYRHTTIHAPFRSPSTENNALVLRPRPRSIRPYDHGTVEPVTGQPDPRAAAVGGLRVRLRVRRSGAVAEGRRR